MNYTKKYPQVSKAACQAKYRRMTKTMGWVGSTTSFECGFSRWWKGKSEPDNQFCDEYAIYTVSNYHAESTLDNMYKSNCKKW